jgi:glycosyltransferase involved in cell wall biosynthesis
MIVGVDIRDMRVAKTGQKTYIEELAKAFTHVDDNECKFVFLDSSLPVYKGAGIFGKAIEHLNLQWWKQVALPVKAWRKKCDIVFCHDYYTPLIRLNFKTIQVFHDAFFYEYPQHYHKLWFGFFKAVSLPAARKCSYISVPTNHARSTVHKYVGIPLEKLVTIYEGPKSLPDLQSDDQDQQYEWLKNEKYLLHVGVIEKRKNLPRLIEAFKKLKDQGYNIKLVLAGKGSGKLNSDDLEQVRKTIAENDLTNDVILTGYVNDSSLSFLYRNALMYVFPSYNEGFGIPVLEAFQFNIPVAVANNTALPEVGGDAVLQFDPFNTDEIAATIRSVLDEPNLRNTLIEKGKQQLKLFSWSKAAEEFISLFKKTMTEEKTN